MASRTRIRAARFEDRDELGALKLRSSLAWGDHTEALLRLPKAGRVPEEHLPFVIVAEAGGTIAGFATILERDGATVELEDLFVAPERWRRGIGSQLLAEAQQVAAARGASSLHVAANARALPFYAEVCAHETSKCLI